MTFSYGLFYLLNVNNINIYNIIMVNIFKRFLRFYKECLEAYGDDLCRIYAYKNN